MLKKIVVFLVFLSVFTSILWAGGRKENLSLTAEDTAGFTDTIDTTKRKPGKSNYYIEATDKAGNVTLAGPENIFFKPESDLPNTTIINPIPNMRVQGNMNVVGIAFDDDGVKGVELSVTRGNGEEILRVNAQGTDFWSYFLDTSNSEIWTDGNYTITAWSTDITGISGISSDFKSKYHKKSVINWVLDRKKPETVITSHETGALVSGNIRLKGTVKDGNGISSFGYSVDEGNTYIPVKTSFDRRDGVYNWEVNINTKNFEEGPIVIWLQAVDGNNSVGKAAHLLFVNNTLPDIKIVYPSPDTVVNGIFSIAGYTNHPVGVKSLSWKAGNFAKGEIELLPGNDWWTADIDLRGQKLSGVDIEIRAEDVSGNVKVTRQKFKVDQNKDLPVVSLTSPVTGNIDPSMGIVVMGSAVDDDGIASIFYSLNSGTPVEIPSSGYFQFLIQDVPGGTNSIEVWAKDNTGVIGPKTAVRGLVAPPALPQPSIVSFTYPGARPAKPALNYNSGMTVRQEPRMVMNISIRASAAPVSSSLIIGDNSLPLKLTASKDLYTAAVTLPDNLPEGLTKVQIYITDRLSREVVFEEGFFITSQMLSSYQEYVTGDDGVERLETRYTAPDAPFSFSFVRQKTLNDQRILLESSDQVLMGVSSLPIRRVTVNGAGAGNIKAEIDSYGRVILSAVSEGDFGPLTLNMQSDKGSHVSSQFRVLADFSGPTVTMQGMTENMWVRTSVPLRFRVTSRSRISAVDYSLDMGATWVSFGQTGADYSRTLDLTAIPDGSIAVLIKATNDSGKNSVTSFTVLKDTQAPQGAVVMPIEDAGVNGTIRMAFTIEEFGALQSVTYRRPASQGNPEITREVFNANTWDKDYSANFLEVLMDSIRMPLAANMRFTFADKAGNQSEITAWPFKIDQQMDVPVVHIILPQEDEIITTDFIISGVMYDDDGIKNIQWRIDNNPWQTLEATAGFSLPVFLSTLTDNEHSVTVIAEDIYGVRSQSVTRRFKVSLSEPAATIVYPLYNTVLKDGIEVRGSSSDKNGIKEVLVSLDNGNTYNNAVGNFNTAAETVQWTYRFNTKILRDGPNVMFIRVIDRYDISATYASMINVDNTPPEIILDSPNDGDLSVGIVSVMGRILDANLKEIDIQLRSLDGATIRENLRSRKIEVSSMIREVIDLTGQADGQYNIAVISTDLANNVSRVSRNFQLARQTYANTIDIMYPLENETVAGRFNLYGRTDGADKAETVTIRINGNDITMANVDDTGYFRFTLDSEALRNGDNTIVVHSNFGRNQTVSSRNYIIKYKSDGPWVTIDSFNFMDFAYNRPYVTGRTGYILSEEETTLLNSRTTDKNTKNELKKKTHDFTEISFDNGRTFVKMDKGKKKEGSDYRFRLENGEMTEGTHYIIVRSLMKNGETAITRMLVQVDKTAPVIRMISPEAGGVYNTAITYSATATDDNELESVKYYLRKGDKSAYEIPGFLQGLYIEGIIPPVFSYFFDNVPTFFAGGATFTDFGLGLSFFDDNVKVQVQYGFMTPEIYTKLGGEGDMRYGGDVIGIKLLANLYTLPFGSFGGPDWEWLSASFGLGANFSFFDFTKKGVNQSKKPTWLSALLLQIEFPKISAVASKRKVFRTFSVFTEGQLWFIPTDVDDSGSKKPVPVVQPKVVVGLRLYIF